MPLFSGLLSSKTKQAARVRRLRLRHGMYLSLGGGPYRCLHTGSAIQCMPAGGSATPASPMTRSKRSLRRTRPDPPIAELQRRLIPDGDRPLEISEAQQTFGHQRVYIVPPFGFSRTD